MKQPSRARPTTKHVILFLAANPPGTGQLALDQEARSIRAELKRGGHRDRFDFETRWAAEPLELILAAPSVLVEVPCPYPGMRPFAADDADRFPGHFYCHKTRTTFGRVAITLHLRRNYLSRQEGREHHSLSCESSQAEDAETPASADPADRWTGRLEHRHLADLRPV
jgi:hypothetical protein